MPLTEPMLRVLRKADLVKGTLDNVPLGTLYGLHDRGLIHWHNSRCTTQGGTFPKHHGVLLTPEGLAIARRQKASIFNTSTKESLT